MDKKVTLIHLAKIAEFLPKWTYVAMLLGLEDQQVTDIKTKYYYEEDQRSEALSKWAVKEGAQATYNKIYEILCKLGKREAAEKVMALAGSDDGQDAQPGKHVYFTYTHIYIIPMTYIHVFLC